MIRWDAKITREFNRIIDNYNAKVRRLQKKGARRLPSVISKRDFKKEFTGRAAKRSELKYQLKELQRFSKRGAEDILILNGERNTRFRIERTKRRRSRILRKLNKEIEYQKKFVNPYKPFTRSRLDMLVNIKQNILQSDLSNDNIRMIDVQFSREYSPSRLDNFYTEFFKNIDKQVEISEYDSEKWNVIKMKLMKLPPDVLYKMERIDDRIAFFFDHYKDESAYNDLDKQSISGNLDSLFDEIDEIINQYIS